MNITPAISPITDLQLEYATIQRTIKLNKTMNISQLNDTRLTYKPKTKESYTIGAFTFSPKMADFATSDDAERYKKQYQLLFNKMLGKHNKLYGNWEYRTRNSYLGLHFHGVLLIKNEFTFKKSLYYLIKWGMYKLKYNVTPYWCLYIIKDKPWDFKFFDYNNLNKDELMEFNWNHEKFLSKV